MAARRNRRTPIRGVNAGVMALRSLIGLEVATARKRRTQKEVADEAGAYQAEVSRLETGADWLTPARAKLIFHEVGIRGALVNLYVYLRAYDFAKILKGGRR